QCAAEHLHDAWIIFYDEHQSLGHLWSLPVVFQHKVALRAYSGIPPITTTPLRFVPPFRMGGPVASNQRRIPSTPDNVNVMLKLSPRAARARGISAAVRPPRGG